MIPFDRDPSITRYVQSRRLEKEAFDFLLEGDAHRSVRLGKSILTISENRTLGNRTPGVQLTVRPPDCTLAIVS